MATDDEINVLIAEKVMGWTLRDWEDGPDYEWWADAKGEHACLPELWRPLTDPAQALRALETFCATRKATASVSYTGTSYEVVLSAVVRWEGDMGVIDSIGRGIDADFPHAVCLALAAAVTDA